MANLPALKLSDAKALPRLALMAASGLLLLTAGWHGQRLFKASGATGQVDSVQAPTAIVSPPADLTTLSQWEPYGAAAQTNAADTAPEVVAPSPLNLQLRGTVAEENGEGGEAIIADEAGLERSYAVGDSIADGVVLHAIRHREVVIKRGEQLESVAMPAIPSSGGGEAPPLPEVTNIPVTTATPESPPPAQPPIPAPGPAPAPGIDNPPVAPDAAIPAPPPPGMSAVPPAEALPPGNE